MKKVKYKLSELCVAEITDGTHKTPIYVDEGYIFLSSKNVTSGRIDWNNVMYIPQTLHDELYARIKPQKNDILLAKNGTTGIAALVDKEEIFDIYVSLALIRPNQLKILPKYLLYAINSPSSKQYFNSHLKGIGVPNLHLTHIRDLPITVYGLEEQKAIAERLDKVSELIEKRKTQLEKLNLLIKSRFIEMFGDPNLNNKDWTIGVINDIGTCVAGATPSTQVQEYWDNGTIPWMSSGEVNKGRVFETDTKITQLGYDNASTKLVPPKTVVLAMAGQGKTRGTAAITEIELCTNQSICSIVNNEKINPEYLLHFLKLQYMELRGASTNTDGRGGLNLKIIGNYPIMIPPKELQNQFAIFVEQIDKSKFKIQKSLEKLEILKKSLMQQYFG